MFLRVLLEQKPWLFWVVFPFGMSLLWHRFRDGNLRYARQRSQKLYALTRNNKWVHANPVALQFAVRDAYGALIDDAWIGVALRRGNPLRMLGDCKLVGGMVRLQADGMRFEPVENLLGIRNFRRAAIVWFLVACMPWITTWALMTFGRPAQQVAIALTVSSFLLAPFCMFMSLCHEAAHRLTAKLDVLYPLRMRHADALATLPRTTPRRRVARAGGAAAPMAPSVPATTV